MNPFGETIFACTAWACDQNRQGRSCNDVCTVLGVCERYRLAKLRCRSGVVRRRLDFVDHDKDLTNSNYGAVPQDLPLNLYTVDECAVFAPEISDGHEVQVAVDPYQLGMPPAGPIVVDNHLAVLRRSPDLQSTVLDGNGYVWSWIYNGNESSCRFICR